MSMKVLIVGARGMLGTALVKAFSSSHQVQGVDLPGLDITDRDQCQRRAGEFSPDVIVNSAALTAVDYCEDHEEEAFRVNGEGAGNLAGAAAAIGAVLVYYSTDYVFDGLNSDAYLEEDPPNPQSVYGRSKWRGEELVRAHCPDHLILRTSWLFGENGKNFVATVLTAARSGQPLRVVNDQRGSPTYTRDLAGCTLRMLDAACRGTYHVTNGGSCSWFELAVRAVEWAGISDVRVTPVTSAEYPRPARRPPNSVLANARLDREGFPPMRPWPLAVQEYIKKL